MGYAPNNCVMVIVGDVNFDQVMALSRKFLEPIPRRDPPPPVRTKEPEQMGERRVTLSKPAQLPIQMILYHIPDSRDPDSPVLDVISTILSADKVRACISSWWIRNWRSRPVADSARRWIRLFSASPSSRAAESTRP
jgi:predicted Zn-dependent peptidase